MKKLRFAIIFAALTYWTVGDAQEQPPENVVSEVLKKALDAYNARNAQALFDLCHPDLQQELQNDFQDPAMRELFKVPPENLLTLLQWGLDGDHKTRGKMKSVELEEFDQRSGRYNVLFRYELIGLSEGFIALKKSEGAWLIIDADFD